MRFVQMKKRLWMSVFVICLNNASKGAFSMVTLGPDDRPGYRDVEAIK